AVLASLVAAVARFNADTALVDWLWTMGAVLYVGFLGSTLVLVRDIHDGRDWVYMTAFSTFAVDTAAYFTGHAIGRHRLAPRISPKKTVEGFAGGYAAGFAAVVLLNYVLGLRVPGGQIAVLALLLPVAATLGDLAESAIKRSMRIKDASELIPGHGGVLDRLDSILFTFALVYLFQQWVGA
ncbi:MAG: phosphatidate cytidylyltransferase, partial [Dehalococcoidia bacterium]